MPAQHVFVCDVSPRSVVAGRFIREHGQLQCLAIRERRLDADAVGGWTAVLPRVLASLREELRFEGPVRIALAGGLVLMRVITPPRVRGRARDRVVRFEAEHLLPYPPSDFVWASAEVAGAADGALWVAAARRVVVESVFAAGDSAGIEVASIEPAPLVLSRLLHGELRSTGPRGLVHLADGAADLMVLDGARSVVRSLALDSGAANSGGGGDAARIDFPTTRHARLCQDVLRTLAHHRRGGGAPVVVLHVAAPRTEQAAVAAALRVQPGVGEVTPLDPHCASMAGDGGRGAGATAVLCALAGEADRGRRANLVPRHVMTRARVRRCRPWLQATAALLVLAQALPVIEARQRLRTAREELAQLDRAAAARQVLQRQREQERQAVLQAVTRVKQLEHLMKARGAWVRLMNDLQRITDPHEGIWIESLAPVEDASTPQRTSPAPRFFAGKPISPSGNVDDVSAFGTTCLVVACLLEPSPPQVGDDRVFRRARAWLDELGRCPQVAAVEHERFEPDAGGLLRVKIVVRLDLAAGEASA